MMSLEAWHQNVHLSLDADSYDPEGLKADLDEMPKLRAAIEERFRWVLETRPFSAQEWEDRNNVDFDSDAELYEYLKRV